MQVRWLKTGDFRREVLSTYFSSKFITLNNQHVCHDAARRMGLSVTADPCFNSDALPTVAKH